MLRDVGVSRGPGSTKVRGYRDIESPREPMCGIDQPGRSEQYLNKGCSHCKTCVVIKESQKQLSGLSVFLSV